MRRIAALLVLAFLTSVGRAQEDEQLFEKVMKRLLASDVVKESYPSKFSWPPKHFIKPSSEKEVNAYASSHKVAGATIDDATKKVRPVVMVTQGMLQRIIKGDENSLAVIMGHELAHLSKQHVDNAKADTDFLFLAFNRDQEIEADLEGVRFTLSAGYPYKVGVANAIQKMRLQTAYTSFEGLSTTHPTWEERLVFLDREQSKLWSSMTAFKNGFVFLELEQYQAAQQCLKAVVAEFPDCTEAWANLGYAQIMQYCDGLDRDDLKRYGIGQIVAGGFYRRPASLEAKVRGVDEKLWNDGVKACKKALALNDDLVLPRATLGLAYLVHPDGKDVKKANQYFSEALDKGSKDPEFKKSSVARAALLVNAGVAEMAAGDLKEPIRKFRQAVELASDGPLTSVVQTLEEAILYNQALIDAKSTSADDKKKAMKYLVTYLYRVHSDTAWWSLALDRYNQLAKELSLPEKTAKEVTKYQAPAMLRLQTSVTVGKETVTLAEPLKDAVARLADKSAVAVPLFEGAKIVRWRFADQGVDLIGKDKILALFLTNDKAPPLVLRSVGVATKPVELRVGMAEKDALALLKDQRADHELRPIADRTTRYRFYPELGLAVRMDSGRLAEIVIAQVPRLRFAEN